jgi:hypothetical protein
MIIGKGRRSEALVQQVGWRAHRHWLLNALTSDVPVPGCRIDFTCFPPYVGLAIAWLGLCPVVSLEPVRAFVGDPLQHVQEVAHAADAQEGFLLGFRRRLSLLGGSGVLVLLDLT